MRLACGNVPRPSSKAPVALHPWTCWVGSRACQATPTSGLRLERSEELRSFRHYRHMRATQSVRGHPAIDRPEERGAGKGSGRRSTLRGREPAPVSIRPALEELQKQHGPGETSERRGGTHKMGFPGAFKNSTWRAHFRVILPVPSPGKGGGLGAGLATYPSL